jgi:hypothetical protein
MNENFLDSCIRICLLARRALKGISPEKYLISIYHAREGTDLFALKLKVINPFWATRFNSWGEGLIDEVFDTSYFIAQKRTLKIEGGPSPKKLASCQLWY